MESCDTRNVLAEPTARYTVLEAVYGEHWHTDKPLCRQSYARGTIAWHMNEIDEYGVIDVTLEDWSNVDVSYERSVNGSTLNNILRSQFILFSGSSDLKFSIPNGYDAWGELSECILVVMRSFCEVDHVMRRVFVLILKSIFLKSTDSTNSCTDIAFGALSFISIWIKHFKNFLSDSDIVSMKKLVEDFVLFLSMNQYMTSPPNSKVQDALLGLSQLLRHTCCLGTMTSKTTPPIKQTVVVGSWDDTADRKERDQRQAREARLSRRQNAARDRERDKSQPVIAVFGVTPDMLNDDDSIESAPPLLGDNKSQGEEGGGEGDERPLPRVPASFYMLQDPSDLQVWDFDLLELARQWTLLDHSLFAAIPLDALHECGWAEPRHSSRATAVRHFIDRFNAVSCWVAESILHLPTPEKRGELYDKFVEVAVHLESLNNFNGVMAVLTGLQQGCLSRLRSSLQFVCLSSQKSLKRLQVLLL